MSRSQKPVPARLRVGLGTLAVVALALLSACSGTPGPPRTGVMAPTSTARSGLSSSPRSSDDADVGTFAVPGQKVTWRTCDGGYQCTTITVPVDYAKPDGATMHLGMVRIPARDQAHKIGALLVNPGGPGASAIRFAEALPLPPEIRARFDVVGFDPRGVGASTPLTCGNATKLYHVDPIPDSPAETAALIDASKRYIHACNAKYAGLLAHLGTRNVARDMDQVRIALHEPKISYVGFSYGTAIGQEYADLFPDRIRAMVLDGIVDVSQSGLAGAKAQGLAFQKALDDFAAHCAATASCAIHSDPAKVIDRVQAQTQRSPIPAPGADRPLGPGEFQLGVIEPLYNRSSWPVLAQALAQADKGDGTALVHLADEYLGIGGFEIYFAVSCLDSTWPTGDPQKVIQAGRSIAQEAPNVGEATVTDYVRCALWPTPPKPLPPTTAKGSPPILVISTTHDPATPYENGVKLAKELPHGVLLTHDGEGHTVYAQGDACVNAAVDRYLLTLRPPADGTTCG